MAGLHIADRARAKRVQSGFLYGYGAQRLKPDEIGPEVASTRWWPPRVSTPTGTSPPSTCAGCAVGLGHMTRCCW